MAIPRTEMKGYADHLRYGEYEPEQLLLAEGLGQWSTVYRKHDGRPLFWGDHDEVYEWLFKAVGLDQRQKEYLYDGSSALTLAEANGKAEAARLKAEAAELLRAEAAALLERAEKLERENG